MTTRATAVVLVVAGAALSVAIAFTHPFTLAADVLVAVALVGLVAVVVAQWRARKLPGLLARRGGDGAGEAPARLGARVALWLVPLGALAAWELAAYLQAPRVAHPTLSSMLDAADGTALGRAVAFACWLVLGWYLVTR